MTSKPAQNLAAKPLAIEREYGPLGDGTTVHGVEHDGDRVWLATGEKLCSLDPQSGELGREIAAPCDAGTAFDGTHFYQLAEAEIVRIDATTGEVVGRIDAPGKGRDSGLAWAEGSLWVGQFRERKIHRVDPATGEVLSTLTSDRFVTGVTWVNDELWHGTWEEEKSELRRIDARTGEVEERYAMPDGIAVSGLAHDGKGTFYCGGGSSGKVRAVRPRR